MIEKQVEEEVARELIGGSGHWIDLHERGGNNGDRYAIFSPDGVLLGMKFGKERAEAAVMELIATGKISGVSRPKRYYGLAGTPECAPKQPHKPCR
jgi:hypothetical protein